MFKKYIPHKSILIILSNAVSDFRMTLAKRHLIKAGYDVDIISEVPFYKAGHYDIFLICRPTGGMPDFIKFALQAGKKVILDFDDDFNAIPKHNPAYQYSGPGNPTYLNDINRLMKTPGVLVTYASPQLESRYKVPGIVVPNYFDEENIAWEHGTKKINDGYVKIGFTGTPTHREDFKLVKETLKKILLQNKKTKIVVGVDSFIYEDMVDVPENQKLFIPGLDYSVYPLSFKYFDILITPLRNTFFNLAKSDIKLLEAGATKTPWVASDLPFYSEWGVGGGIVKNDDWETPLNTLIEDSVLRQSLGEAGYIKAKTRTSKVICQKWVEIMEILSK